MKAEYYREENTPSKENSPAEKSSKRQNMMNLSQEQISAWPQDLGSRLVSGNCVFVEIVGTW